MGVPQESLSLRLVVEGGAVRSVDLSATRITHASGVLEGRTLEEALRLVPLLFALCGRAQAEAAAAAVDAAAGRAPPEPERAARALLVAVEAVDQHLRAILGPWSEAAGLAPDVAGYAQLHRVHAQLPRRLRPEGFRLGVGARALAPDRAGLDADLRTLEAAVEAMAPAAALSDPTGWCASAEGPAAAALRAVLRTGHARVGPAKRLEPLDPVHVERALATDRAFSARPARADGAPSEVGPLARHHAHPAVRAVVQAEGPGVFARMFARLVDLRARLEEARAELGALEARDDADAALGEASGAGLGSAETARGPLFHRVELSKGRVAGWRAVAPTEWSLHPEGAVRSLEGMTEAAAEPAARWLLLALDPCVPASIVVERGD